MASRRQVLTLGAAGVATASLGVAPSVLAATGDTMGQISPAAGASVLGGYASQHAAYPWYWKSAALISYGSGGQITEQWHVSNHATGAAPPIKLWGVGVPLGFTSSPIHIINTPHGNPTKPIHIRLKGRRIEFAGLYSYHSGFVLCGGEFGECPEDTYPWTIHSTAEQAPWELSNVQPVGNGQSGIFMIANDRLVGYLTPGRLGWEGAVHWPGYVSGGSWADIGTPAGRTLVRGVGMVEIYNGAPRIFVQDSNGHIQLCSRNGNGPWSWLNLTHPFGSRPITPVGVAHLAANGQEEMRVFLHCTDGTSYDGLWMLVWNSADPWVWQCLWQGRPLWPANSGYPLGQAFGTNTIVVPGKESTSTYFTVPADNGVWRYRLPFGRREGGEWTRVGDASQVVPIGVSRYHHVDGEAETRAIGVAPDGTVQYWA